MRARRAALFTGRNPSKKNRSAGSPATVSAASSAEAPGIGTTRTPAAMAAPTSRAPGSDSSGVPASEISAMASPARRRATRPGSTSAALYS